MTASVSQLSGHIASAGDDNAGLLASSDNILNGTVKVFWTVDQKIPQFTRDMIFNWTTDVPIPDYVPPATWPNGALLAMPKVIRVILLNMFPFEHGSWYFQKGQYAKWIQALQELQSRLPDDVTLDVCLRYVNSSWNGIFWDGCFTNKPTSGGSPEYQLQAFTMPIDLDDPYLELPEFPNITWPPTPDNELDLTLYWTGAGGRWINAVIPMSGAANDPRFPPPRNNSDGTQTPVDDMGNPITPEQEKDREDASDVDPEGTTGYAAVACSQSAPATSPIKFLGSDVLTFVIIPATGLSYWQNCIYDRPEALDEVNIFEGTTSFTNRLFADNDTCAKCLANDIQAWKDAFQYFTRAQVYVLYDLDALNGQTIEVDPSELADATLGYMYGSNYNFDVSPLPQFFTDYRSTDFTAIDSIVYESIDVLTDVQSAEQAYVKSICDQLKNYGWIYQEVVPSASVIMSIVNQHWDSTTFGPDDPPATG